MRKDIGARPPDPDATATLAERLEQTEETLRAIQNYLVDAFVVRKGDEEEVVTLDAANYPYRAMVECMNEGAVTLISDGTIFYANPRFSEMVGMETRELIGTRFRELILPEQQETFDSVLGQTSLSGSRTEYSLRGSQGAQIPVQLSLFQMAVDGARGVSILVTDVSERVAAEHQIRGLASRLARAEQEERLRISQVLHDDLLQRLFAIKAQLSLLQDATDKGSGSGSFAGELGYMDEWLNQTISITRDLSIELIPAVLQTEGLAEAITWLASHLRKQGDIQAAIQVKGSFPRVEGALRTLLFQAVRDLLFSLVRDSEGQSCSIVLEKKRREALITLEWADGPLESGTPVKDPAVDYGLTLIRDRLGVMGCSLKITSKPGKGNRAVIGIPLERLSATT